MLKLIVGTKGSGKTKTMIDMIDKAVKTTSGNIVVLYVLSGRGTGRQGAFSTSFQRG